jgi:hypothetical protein
MTDRFANTQSSLSSPASGGLVVLPSDEVPLPETSRALYVGAAGSITVKMLSGDSITFEGVARGALLPIRVTQVFQTGTTAGAIVALL